ncbi:hypothetical protein ACFO3I_01785 [Rheinheimera marina]|uniref:Uncharacterized protein n=1 Tax=Rheinheimera marina TaxID=1774958 RepID=A0ABV9JGF1_9GAMM
MLASPPTAMEQWVELVEVHLMDAEAPFFATEAGALNDEMTGVSGIGVLDVAILLFASSIL